VIFLTVGSMFPFDRLVEAMDAWKAAQPEAASLDVLAQVGDGTYEPRHMRWVRRLDRADYAATVAVADLVVAHAGVGSVIAAGERGKPIVVLPRRRSFGEHTSDHQVETASWLRGKPGVYVADTETALAECVARALREGGAGGATLSAIADNAFINRLRDFILK
jgi:UDP-N-acetylglucosamine transferase subunit ALG13